MVMDTLNSFQILFGLMFCSSFLLCVLHLLLYACECEYECEREWDSGTAVKYKVGQCTISQVEYSGGSIHGLLDKTDAHFIHYISIRLVNGVKIKSQLQNFYLQHFSSFKLIMNLLYCKGDVDVNLGPQYIKHRN